MKRNYHTLDNRGKANERKLVEFLAQNGQQILPMVELITESRMAIDDLVNAMGRATIETVLQLSAEQVAGRPQQGRRRGEGIFWHGKQAGSVYLRERKLKVDKPRLRKKGDGVQAEVAVPAYAAMQDQIGMGSRVLDILMEGVSTRQYGAVIPKMADTVGVSKSSVSRAAIQASDRRGHDSSLDVREYDIAGLDLGHVNPVKNCRTRLVFLRSPKIAALLFLFPCLVLRHPPVRHEPDCRSI